MSYVPDSFWSEVEELKKTGHLDEALRKINHILVKDPNNEDALLQVVDIQYRKGEIAKAEKPIDFIISQKGGNEPLNLYIKGVLEMEKNNWVEAKKYLREAIKLTKAENHEIIRCYGLCEYWHGNREKGIDFLKLSFDINKYDAEVICNLIEIYILEQNYRKAKNMIKYYHNNYDKLMSFDKELNYYDKKLQRFEKFLQEQKT